MGTPDLESTLDQVSLRDVLDASPDGLLFFDSEGRVVLSNRRAEELFGYPEGSLVGRQVEDLLPQSQRRMHAQHRAQYQENPQVRAMGVGRDLVALTADGTEVPVDIALSPLTLGSDLGVIATVRDDAQRRQALTDRTDEAVAAEEIRIAQGLMDTVIGGLFRAGLTLHGTLDIAGPAAQERIRAAIDQIDGVIHAMRQVIFDVSATSGSGAPVAGGRPEGLPGQRGT